MLERKEGGKEVELKAASTAEPRLHSPIINKPIFILDLHQQKLAQNDTSNSIPIASREIILDNSKTVHSNRSCVRRRSNSVLSTWFHNSFRRKFLHSRTSYYLQPPPKPPNLIPTPWKRLQSRSEVEVNRAKG